MQPILEVNKLTRKFKDFVAVDNISFSLLEGEILGLLGPNGAGKTTTLQMLLGVLNKTSGEIKYFGKELTKHREEILEQVNFSSTYTNLPWELTVEENLKYIAYLYDIKDRKKRVEKIIQTFKLQKLRNHVMEGLSAGQLTRVNLAKAFINYPRVLLLDEPTASLDPDVAQYIREFLLNERKQFKVSIIITSHNMSEVEEVCDRVIFINQGKIIANDTPEKLAKTIKISHLKMLVVDGLKRTQDYCQQQGIACQVKGRYTLIDVKEDQVSAFLKALEKMGVTIDELSIDRPNLHDYFLEVSKQRNTNVD